MQIVPVNYNKQNKSFGHNHHFMDNDYSKGQKAIIAATTALGVAASSAILAKKAGYSLKPSKMFKNIKNSYLAKVEFHDKEVISLGTGSCLGGLAGGYMIDNNPHNRRSKNREAVMQIGNISIPIITVEQFAKFGEKYGKIQKGIAAVAGIFVGVYFANFLMNKVSNLIFQNKSDERDVKATDFSAHLDDMVVAASCISDNKYVQGIARIIPVALMIPGFEVGTKKSGNH